MTCPYPKSNPISYIPPELKVESRGVINRPIKSSICPIIRASIMNVKHDMALFLIGRFEGWRPEFPGWGNSGLVVTGV